MLLRNCSCILLKIPRSSICGAFLTVQNRITSTNFQPPATLAAKLVSSSPQHLQPYMKLARLDRPAGFWLIYFPCTWGIAASALSGHLPPLSTLSLFAVGTLVMRGAACTVNDLWDRDIDAKVTRTCSRPLVNGDVTVPRAIGFLLAQLAVGLMVLVQLNVSCIVLGVSCMGLVLTYPAAKRTLRWPQLLLGFTVNWGVLMGYTASRGALDLYTCAPIYAAAIFWTMFYDTIYAHMDREDDLKLGIQSTAISFGTDTKLWISVFGCGVVSNLVLTGVVSNQSWMYYSIISAVGFHLARQVYTLDINDADNCFRKFASTFEVGLLVFLALAVGTALKNNNDKVEDT